MSRYQIGDVSYRYGTQSSEWLPCDGGEISTTEYPELYKLLPGGSYEGETFNFLDNGNGDSEVFITKGGVYAYKVENGSLWTSSDGGSSFVRFTDTSLIEPARIPEVVIFAQFKYLAYLPYTDAEGNEKEVLFSNIAISLINNPMCSYCDIYLDETGAISSIRISYNNATSDGLQNSRGKTFVYPFTDESDADDKVIGVALCNYMARTDTGVVARPYLVRIKLGTNLHPLSTSGSLANPVLYQSITYTSSILNMEMRNNEFYIYHKNNMRVMRNISDLTENINDLISIESYTKTLPVVHSLPETVKAPVVVNEYTYYAEDGGIYRIKDGEPPERVKIYFTTSNSSQKYENTSSYIIDVYYGNETSLIVSERWTDVYSIELFFNLETQVLPSGVGKVGRPIPSFIVGGHGSYFFSVNKRLNINQIEYDFQSGMFHSTSTTSGAVFSVVETDEYIYIYTDRAVASFSRAAFQKINILERPADFKTTPSGYYIKSKEA